MGLCENQPSYEGTAPLVAANAAALRFSNKELSLFVWERVPDIAPAHADKFT
ncbi:hypothetical protein KSX_35350 [Ktedonospora formicarum]|uniref:Uncharacterized protein n=1 Tax=Ktedonospora formicarum TaxID=2778364 RepID=A0A8J3MQY7_9CHLR|nr:hypothetical protein KSX_35350 [Ktedonospora formicarum]